MLSFLFFQKGGKLSFFVNVGLSMMCYTLGKANKTCLGERQLRGRIGKLL